MEQEPPQLEEDTLGCLAGDGSMAGTGKQVMGASHTRLRLTHFLASLRSSVTMEVASLYNNARIKLAGELGGVFS